MPNGDGQAEGFSAAGDSHMNGSLPPIAPPQSNSSPVNSLTQEPSPGVAAYPPMMLESEGASAEFTVHKGDALQSLKLSMPMQETELCKHKPVLRECPLCTPCILTLFVTPLPVSSLNRWFQWNFKVFGLCGSVFGLSLVLCCFGTNSSAILSFAGIIISDAAFSFAVMRVLLFAHKLTKQIFYCMDHSFNIGLKTKEKCKSIDKFWRVWFNSLLYHLNLVMKHEKRSFIDTVTPISCFIIAIWGLDFSLLCSTI